MLNYLINYGVKSHEIESYDLDVNDRLELESQINKVRFQWIQLMKLLDDIQNKSVELSKQISVKTKELVEKSLVEDIKLTILYSTDDEYLELIAKKEALSTGAGMIKSQIDFCQTDLKILNSVFYNKY